MIGTILLSATIALINPADPSMSTIYPSGIKDADSKIFSAPHSSKAPLLRIGTPLKSADGYVIQPGCYLVKPTQDDKFLRFFQSGKMVFELPVVENTVVKKHRKKPGVEAQIFEHNKFMIIYQLDNVVKKSVIPIVE